MTSHHHNRKCEHPGCTTHPSFGYEGERATRCAQHRRDGMIGVAFAHRWCGVDGCQVQAHFALPGERPVRCAQHRDPGMVEVVKKRCEAPDCTTSASYALPGDRPSRCSQHSLPGMINVTNRRCKTPLCDTVVNRRYGGEYCARCFRYTFPHSPLVRNHKTKERAVVDAVRAAMPDDDASAWALDRPIAGGCSRRRPDMYRDMGGYVLVVEVDENQHEHYDPACEDARMMQLFADGGSRPLVLVRFNPDGYTRADGTRAPTCWGYSAKRGVCALKASLRDEWARRLRALTDALARQVEEATRALGAGARLRDVALVRLFYDE